MNKQDNKLYAVMGGDIEQGYPRSEDTATFRQQCRRHPVLIEPFECRSSIRFDSELDESHEHGVLLGWRWLVGIRELLGFAHGLIEQALDAFTRVADSGLEV